MTRAAAGTFHQSLKAPPSRPSLGLQRSTLLPRWRKLRRAGFRADVRRTNESDKRRLTTGGAGGEAIHHGAQCSKYESVNLLFIPTELGNNAAPSITELLKM